MWTDSDAFVDNGEAQARARLEAAIAAQTDPDVVTLLTTLQEAGTARLTGRAGTGKTTKIMQIMSCGAFNNVHLIAPTGRAARRMTEVTSHPASTIHSAIYGSPTEDEETGELRWPEVKPIGSVGDLVIVDEVSMVNEDLMWDLVRALGPGVKILCVGDRHQLPPVSGGPGVNLQESEVELTQIWRTAGSAAGNQINEFASAILSAPSGAALSQLIQRAHRRWPQAVFHSGAWSPPVWRATMEGRQEVSSTLITYRNEVRHSMNFQTRAALGYAGDFCDGAELLLVRSNLPQLGVMNGDILRYIRCIDEEDPDLPNNLTYAMLEDTLSGRRIRAYLDQKSIFVNPLDSRGFRTARREDSTSWARTMYRGKRGLNHTRWQQQKAVYETDNYALPLWGPAGMTLHCDFAYTLTGHAMQGSEADVVGILWGEWPYFKGDRLEEARAWWYTCVTRARRSLVLFLPGVEP